MQKLAEMGYTARLMGRMLHSSVSAFAPFGLVRDQIFSQ
jgi:hypothetical protein